MIRKYGNILEQFTAPDRDKLLVFTANGVLDRKGRLIMGAGIAKEIRDKYPGIDEWFGNALIRKSDILEKVITYNKEEAHAFHFNILRGVYKGQSICALQTKLHFSNPSTLELVSESLERLKQIVFAYKEVHLVMPGVGHGKLPLSKILPLVETLPDNCIVWSKRDMF